MPDLHCLMTIRNPGELNRLLIQLREFKRSDGRADMRRLQKSLKNQTFHAGPVPFEDLLDLALHFRLIHVYEDSVSVTHLGDTFLDENPNNQYNLTEAQKNLLVQSIFFGRTQLSRQFEIILGDFSFNTLTSRYEGSILAPSGRLPALEIRLLCSALHLIDEEEGGIRFFDPRYNTDIARRIRIFRQTELEGQEPSDETIARSKHAEELIFEDEKQRLIEAGYPELSCRIQMVSEYNSAAGFDIQSYDGDGSKPEVPDRFIEVKSSILSKFRFIITGNELKKARELKDQYRIIFLGNHDFNKNLKDCLIRVLIDPITHIFDPDRFSIYAKKIHVIEKKSDALEISEQNSN